MRLSTDELMSNICSGMKIKSQPQDKKHCMMQHAYLIIHTPVASHIVVKHHKAAKEQIALGPGQGTKSPPAIFHLFYSDGNISKTGH